MYTNSKNQISLEEAYRMVHIEEKVDDEKSDVRECGCPKDECTCNHKDDEKEEGKEEGKEEIEESLVDVATAIVQDNNPSHVVGEMARWAFAIGTAYGTGALFANQEKAASFIAELMRIPRFGAMVREIEEALKGDDMQEIVDAHNKKVRLLRILDNKVIKFATERGFLRDPRKALESLEKDVDIVEQEIANLKKR
jgi:hypothetical protein